MSKSPTSEMDGDQDSLISVQEGNPNRGRKRDQSRILQRTNTAKIEEGPGKEEKRAVRISFKVD